MEYICNDCPRRCGALRDDARGGGFCKMPAQPKLARAALHFDEEPVVSGTRGSGAVFFSGCSLRCRFCQNFELSHHGFGRKITVARLREIYFELIAQGAHNINLVNPTHYVRAILESLSEPLPVPVVWNSGGYERVETLKTLEGRVQIYLPDLKFFDPARSTRYWSNMASQYKQSSNSNPCCLIASSIRYCRLFSAAASSILARFLSTYMFLSAPRNSSRMVQAS